MAAPGPTGFVKLSDDCILHVFRWADVLDIIAMRQTCHRVSSLSRSHSTWRFIIERLASEGKIAHLMPKFLEAPAEDLEDLVTRSLRIHAQIRRKEVIVNVLQDHRWTFPPVQDPSVLPEPDVLQMWTVREENYEFYRTGVWVTPGWFLVGSFVRERGVDSEYGFVSLFDLGHNGAAVAPGDPPSAKYMIPSFPGSASEFFLSQRPIADEQNTYLVLVGTWTKTSWMLLKVHIPAPTKVDAYIEKVGELMGLPRHARATSVNLGGDYVAFLNDVSGSLGSIMLWNWRECTCRRFKVFSAYDRQRPVSTADGSGPILVIPPYLIYIKSGTFILNVSYIPPAEHFVPIGSFDPSNRDVPTLASWSTQLPWAPTEAQPYFQLTVVESGRAARRTATVEIDFTSTQHAGSAKLVISKGRSQQTIRKGQEVTFPFRAEISDVVNRPNPDMVIGMTSIPGSLGWFNSEQLDILLRSVIRIRGEPSTHSDPNVRDRRVLLARSDLQSRVAIDPMLGRFCMFPESYPGLYITDLFGK